jgi:hypothetical protein
MLLRLPVRPMSLKLFSKLAISCGSNNFTSRLRRCHDINPVTDVEYSSDFRLTGSFQPSTPSSTTYEDSLFTHPLQDMKQFPSAENDEPVKYRGQCSGCPQSLE